MLCGRCKYEFCWLCLGPFFAYQHTEKSLACPYRYVSVVGVMFALILLTLSKLGYVSPLLGSFIFPIFYYLSAYLLVDCQIFAIIMGIYHCSFKKITDLWSDYVYLYRRNRKTICEFVKDRTRMLLKELAIFIVLVSISIIFMVAQYRINHYFNTMVTGIFY